MDDQDVDEQGNDSETPSRAGSEASGYANKPPRNYIDLTCGNLCMVIFSRTEQGRKVSCVCGNDRDGCLRPGHQAKQDTRNKQGHPRYYIRFPGPRGCCDGRLDRGSLTQDEGDRSFIEEREELERTAQALSGLEVDEESDGAESQVGMPSLRTVTTPSPPPEQLNSREPSLRPNAVPNPVPGVPGPQIHQGDSATEPTPPQIWTGLEHPRTLVRIYHEGQPGAIINMISRGYEIKATLTSVEAAQRWCSHDIEERMRRAQGEQPILRPAILRSQTERRLDSTSASTGSNHPRFTVDANSASGLRTVP